ncbi:MAG: cofactor assembly of complex C subunit B [Cyanobium sp. ELA507]
MGFSPAARTALLLGVVGLVLTVLNQATAPSLDPPLERASVLAGILSVLLMLAGALWQQVIPAPAERVGLEGQEGLLLDPLLPADLREELGWGSTMLLTATPAAVVLVQRGDQCLLRRGLLASTPFLPGPICRQASERQRPISLVDLAPYPGRGEFMGLLEGLPAVVVQPLGSSAWLVVGGWAPRCFSRADLVWIEGWARRLTARWAQELDGAALAPLPDELAAGTGSPPDPLEP